MDDNSLHIAAQTTHKLFDININVKNTDLTALRDKFRAEVSVITNLIDESIR